MSKEPSLLAAALSHLILDIPVHLVYDACMFNRKGQDHGSNRRTEEDPSDSGTNTGTATATSAIGGTSTREAEGPSKPLIETVQSDIPILAKREANLYLSHAMGYPFGTVTDKGAFGILSKATCQCRYAPYGKQKKQHRRDDTPNIECECGFYAIPLDAWSDYTATYRVTLLVELSGTVIEHDLGFRAQYQKVVECQVPPCAYCGRRADHLLLNDGMGAERFVCDTHIAATPIGYLYLDIDSLQHRIGVPVTRLELP